jgi:hypothetical protein
MLHIDSVEKVVERYFATVAREAFSFNGKMFVPKVLKVSPLLLRDYTCPPGCGGCCFKFSLDYLPSEARPPGTSKRTVEFNGRSVEIWTDWQTDNDTNRCQNLQRETGRCGIYERRPFTCDFELIRTLQAVDDADRANVLTQKLFGRGWSYARTDGGKGALCEMTPITEKSILEVIRKLKRLKAWTDHFQLDTWIPDLIQIIKEGRLTRQIQFHPYQKTGFGL